MRKKGSVSRLRRGRAEDIYRAYLDLIGERGTQVSRMADVYNRVIAMPSRRFWVSGRRATEVVARLLRGLPPGVRGERLRMFEEIAARAAAMSADHPHLPLLYIVEKIVLQPAPCFYISPESARKILIEQSRRRRQDAVRHKAQLSK